MSFKNDNYKKIVYWLWVSLSCGVGSITNDRILMKFGYSAEAIYRADEEDYLDIEGINRPLLRRLCEKDLSKAEELYDVCKSKDIDIITYEDDIFPERLKKITKKPFVLYVRGILPRVDGNVLISEVGNRIATRYGESNAYLIAHDLARGGAVVVSGMAAGIDSCAHRGCLDAGGKTIAVLGCGIDRPYPKENSLLYDEIIANGAVISEYMPGTPPIGYNFPHRNRIISALSLGTLVVEGDETSGSMITARCALSHGRDLFALPGKTGEKNSRGTNKLIKEGAKMVESAADILTEYADSYPSIIKLDRLPQFSPKNTASPLEKLRIASGLLPPDSFYSSFDKKHPGAATIEPGAKTKPTKKRETIKKQEKLPDMSPEEKAVYDCLSFAKGMSPDQINIESLSAADITTALTTLEIMGVIESLPGGIYVKK